MACEIKGFPVLKACEIANQPEQEEWMIKYLWGRAAVGIIGGAPKCCKSWLGLDMATSVASKTPCLGYFAVEKQGPALIYLAEDSIPMVKNRIVSLCQVRNLDIEKLDLHVISSPALRLDLEEDQNRLKTTIEKIRPALLLLDPLVRIHRLDENSAMEISRLLGFLRELQRTFDLAVIIVHHTSKRRRAQPGQALRGSSDLHAFGDSNAYLAKKQDHFMLTVEHRAAKVPEPIPLELVTSSDGSAAHLKIRTIYCKSEQLSDLGNNVMKLLSTAAIPMTRTSIRAKLKVNNKKLGDTLLSFQQLGKIIKTPKGWIILKKNEQQSLF